MTENRRLIEISLSELEQLKKEDSEKKKGEPKFDQGVLNQINDRILIIKLRDLVNDEYWDDSGEGFTILSRKTPASIKEYRSILNDPKTNDEEKKRLITEYTDERIKTQKSPNFYGRLGDKGYEIAAQILNLRVLIGASVGLKINGNTIHYNPHFGSYFYHAKSSLDSLQKTINPNHEADKKFLDLLKNIVDEKIFWSDKGKKNNKVNDDDNNDFTPPLIIGYRKILSDNTITQKDKILAIQEISKEHQINKAKYPDLYHFKNHVVHMFASKNADDKLTAKSNLKKFHLNIQNIQMNQNRINPSLYQKLKTILDNPVWDNKRISPFGKGAPDGIEKCREILNDNELNEDDKIQDILMLCQGKDQLHRERDKSVFFKKPTDPDVTKLYKQITEVSHKWHKGILKQTDLESITIPDSMPTRSHKNKI